MARKNRTYWVGAVVVFLMAAPLVAFWLSPKVAHQPGGESQSSEIVPVSRTIVPTTPSRRPAPERTGSDVLRSAGAGNISGRVFGPDGVPISKARVLLCRSASITTGDALTRATEIETSEDGSFHFTRLPLAYYTIWGQKDPLAAMTTVMLKDDAYSAFVNLVLCVSGSIGGKVIDKTNAPIIGAHIMPIEYDGLGMSPVTRPFEVQTDSDGAFRVDFLPEESWKLRISASNFASLDTPAIRVGDVDNVFVLSSGGDIVGTIVRQDGKPVARTNVVAINLDREQGEISRGTTDNMGRFGFEHLPAGKHGIALDDPRLVLLDHPVLVEVQPGETMEIALTAVIGPVIFGRVYDKSTGGGIENAIVSAFQTDLRLLPVRREITDEYGEYSLSGLAFGEWQVSAAPSAGAGIPWQDLSRTIQVQRSMNEAMADFVVDLGVAISGTVTHSDGSPAPGCRVVVRGRALRETCSDEDGMFRLTGFEPGETLRISAETSTLQGALPDSVTVPESGLTGLRIVLGVSRSSSISGTVTDPSLRPLVMYVLARQQEGEKSSADLSPMTVSDSAGRFALVGLPAGSYELRLAPRDPERFVRPLGPTTTVEVRENQRLHGVRLVYDEGEFLSIAGRVIDSRGNPIAGATIRVSCPDRRGRSARSDETGAYVVRDIPEGLCRVEAFHSQYSTELIANVPAGATNVDICMGMPASVAGTVIASRDGKPIPQFAVGVIRTQSPDNVNPPDLAYRMYSDPEGRFRVKVEPGPNVLCVRAQGYLPVQLALGHIQAGQDVEGVRVQLEQGKTVVSGAVVDASGNSVANALIFVGPVSRQLTPSSSISRSADDGTFVLRELSPGTVTLTAWLPSYGRGNTTVAVESDSETTATIVVHPDGALCGYVLRGAVPVPSARVTLLDPETRDTLASAVADESGYYALDQLIPGSVTVVVRTDEPRQETTTNAVIEAGVMAHLDLVMD